MIKLNHWWTYTKPEIMDYVYWLRDQLPPADKKKYDESWAIIQADLEHKYGRGDEDAVSD